MEFAGRVLETAALKAKSKESCLLARRRTAMRYCPKTKTALDVQTTF